MKFLYASSLFLIALVLSYFILHRTPKDLPTLAHEMKVQLEQKVLPYWFDTAQDTSRGGYLLKDDAVSGRKRPTEKQIVSQSRMIWTFSRAHLAGFSDHQRNYLQAAEQGYRFLIRHFLDKKQGGYFWSTDLLGKCKNDGKFLYGEAFVIYALSEYYRASQDPEVLAHAMDLYRAIQTHLHDEKTGGWFEQADGDWKVLEPKDPRNLFHRTDCKSSNAHLHWMEALIELYDVSHDAAVKESLIEALRLNQTYFWPEDPSRHAAWTGLDWSPLAGGGLSYGHNAEFAWLMIRTENILGQEPSWNRFYALLDHAIQYGCDEKRGGVYKQGFENYPASDTEKVWWVQAEMLAALSDSLQHQSNPVHETTLRKLLAFVNTYQTSPKDGIWLSSVSAEGRPRDTSKADSWKANYHDVRAMLKFIEAHGTRNN